MSGAPDSRSHCSEMAGWTNRCPHLRAPGTDLTLSCVFSLGGVHGATADGRMLMSLSLLERQSTLPLPLAI